MKAIDISGLKVGASYPPFVIAELSGNHNQSLDRALKMVEAAAATGVHALKLQTYTADTLTINHRGGLFDINDKNSLWYGKNLYELYQEAYTPWEWHAPIFNLARDLGLVVFSSPFDDSAVDFLEELNAPVYKIASFESNHHPLLQKVASTGKPVIISSGTSNIEELKESVSVLKNGGCDEIVILKCTSTYPASPENTNLRTIPEFQKIFPDCVIGLSDHTMGIGASVAAVALGARVIEKHFTLRRADGGVDSAFSMEPEEFRLLVSETERAFLALGEVQLNAQSSEEKSRRFKRSIYVVRDISAGELFTADNIRIIRPGDGMAPKNMNKILGRKARMDIPTGTPLKPEHIEFNSTQFE